MLIKFQNSYLSLPSHFYQLVLPTPVKKPEMAIFNHALAKTLGLNETELTQPENVGYFSGNLIPDQATPLAQAYAGHQFGHFTMLGDGRAILLGEHIDSQGSRFDIQLKGPGQTPYSRRGDGRAALGPMLREYIISEAMHALGIPTTRSLAVVTTGEPVYRETPLPGAILTRVASSHLRVGTFQYAAGVQKPDGLKIIADYTIQRHYPELANSENPYLSFLSAVIDRQSKLIAQWMHVGFIHGVMNTDNMSIAGETIDYGPCAFMDTYHPETVFSSIDRHGRYAYANQPKIAQWNLARFSETLLPLLNENTDSALALAKEQIDRFPAQFMKYWLAGMRLKLGLTNEESGDSELANQLLSMMAEKNADYTNTMRALSSTSLPDNAFFKSEEFTHWNKAWLERLARQPGDLTSARQLMNQNNPVVIPRNHLVEEALGSATENGDYSKTKKLVEILLNPFEETNENTSYREPPAPSDQVYQTFCGT